MSMIHMHYKLGVTAVLCETRCGHTSMQEHFNSILGLNITTVDAKNINLYDVDAIKAHRVVLVVRQPYDRLWSAKKNADRMVHEGYLKSTQHDQSMSDHSSLYLHKLSQSSNITHIIPFEHLLEYIPVSTNTVQYHIEPNHTIFEDWMGNYHSEEDMKLEYSGYTKLLNDIPQFGVKKWQKYCE